MRGIYRERRDTLRDVLESRLGTIASVCGGSAGLQLLYRFNVPIDDGQVVAEAFAEGVFCRPLSMYYAGRVDNDADPTAPPACRSIASAAQLVPPWLASSKNTCKANPITWPDGVRPSAREVHHPNFRATCRVHPGFQCRC